jgi:peptidoglycan/xylan/chitin deacetylase (PgdA/CDA1 family)
MRIYTLHSVAENGISLSPRLFRRFMSYTRRRHGFADLGRVDQEASSGRAVITFDDCYADNFSNALPVLDEMGAKAIFFFSPGFLGAVTWGSPKRQKWSETRSAEFHVPFGFMGLRELEILRELGHEIGFHSRTHRNLTECSDTELRDEIVVAKSDWEERLGFKFRYFAYPRGKNDARMPPLIKEAGFELAFTTRPGEVGSDDVIATPFLLPRYPVMRKGLFGWL